MMSNMSNSNIINVTVTNMNILCNKLI